MRTGGPRLHEAWADHLLAEAALEVESARTFDTLYLGGGTPSWLAPELLERILRGLSDGLDTRADCHLYLEANPEDVTVERLAAWRSLGVQTLSLGVQAFDEAALALLKRRHRPDEARRAVELALEAGFTTVSVDLIYGYPGHEPVAWRRTLDEALSLGPQHLSCYQLTVHEGTLFARRRRRGELVELCEPVQAELFLTTHRHLSEAGYEGYEVCSFARGPAHRSRHNMKYWSHTPYVGLGPSAHSFDGRRRWWNERRLQDWQERLAAGDAPVAGREELSRSELALENLMLGLRMAEGIDLEAFERRFGVDLLGVNRARVDSLVERGLLRLADGLLSPTLAGLAVADGLAAELRLNADGL